MNGKVAVNDGARWRVVEDARRHDAVEKWWTGRRERERLTKTVERWTGNLKTKLERP